MKHIITIFISLFITGTIYATKWAKTEMIDPLNGEKVPAKGIMSSGEYIYNWPSKYDLVFWPLTDEAWICFNPKNGYIAFNNDFEALPDTEKVPLKKWLRENYDPQQMPRSFDEKLAWLEKVYGQRKMDDEFWCTFYRLMAYVHREDEAKSLEYVNMAIPLLEKRLQENTEGIKKIEVLYLLGEYYRRLGEKDKAIEYFAQVKSARYIDKEGKEHIGHPYFISLIQDREKLNITPDTVISSSGSVHNNIEPVWLKYTVGLSRIGIGFAMYGGYQINIKPMNDYFENVGTFGMMFGFHYRNLTLDFDFYSGGGSFRIKQFFIDKTGKTWPKDLKVSSALFTINLGYMFRIKRFYITPFCGISSLQYKSVDMADGKYESPTCTALTMGINTDFELINLQFHREGGKYKHKNNRISIRLRTGYSDPTLEEKFKSDFKNGILFINIGLNFSVWYLKRDR